MENNTQNIQTNRTNSFSSPPEQQESEDKNIAEVTSSPAQEIKSNESSAFSQVMTQMNIADVNEFDAHYAQLWQQASENKEMLSILICEIDYFKDYNEHYGHQAAAFMLLVVALELKTKCAQFGGFLARYKADKFAILIKGGDIKKVEGIAESIRRGIEESKTEHNVSKISNMVTLSIGTSNIYPTSMKMLINEADAALRISQKSGNKQTNLSLVVEKTDPTVNSKMVSSRQEEPLKMRTSAPISIQKNSTATISSVVVDNKKEQFAEKVERETTRQKAALAAKKSKLQDEEFDMISQLKGITPSTDNIQTQPEKKSTEKADLLSRFKSLIPSANKGSEEASQQTSSADKLKQQQEEESNYNKLRAELEELKRKSEGTTPAPPIRYY